MKHLKEDELELTRDFVEKAGRVLNNLAVEMIKANAIVITDQKNVILKSLTLREVRWVGKECTQCCWGGIEFLDSRGKRLFTKTKFVC